MPPKKRTTDQARLEEELRSLTPSQLRQQLKEFGEAAGPIDNSNKDLYVRNLARKMTTQSVNTSTLYTVSPTPSPVSSPEAMSSGLTRSPLSNSPRVRRVGVSAPASQTPSPLVIAEAQRKGVAFSSSVTNSSSTTTPNSRKRKAVDVTPHPSKKKATGRTHQRSDLEAIKAFKVEGLTAATFTPFTEDGELNMSMIGRYVEWLLSCGVKNVFLNGTTGESMSLTVTERKQLTQEWIKIVNGRLKVIVHVGTENLKYTCELASHAQASGAVAIGVMPTNFFKPSSIDHLTKYLQKVAESAPHLPMYYYHIPSMTGVTFSMEDFLDQAGPRLPTLRGLKYTSKDLFEFGRCVTSQAEKYQIIYGSDEQFIGALALGGTAAIGSTYNYAGKLYNRLISAYKRKDTDGAKLEQRRSQAMIKLLIKYGAHPGGGKAFMSLCGIDCGPPRLPILPLTDESIKSLESDLRDIGFFEWS